MSYRRSLGQGPALPSPSAPASAQTVTVGSVSAPTSNIQPIMPIPLQHTQAANIHRYPIYPLTLFYSCSPFRHVLSRGAIIGISLGITVVVISIVLLAIHLRRRRRNRRYTDVESRRVSPFVRLRSGTPVGGPEILPDIAGARLWYLEKQIRTARASSRDGLHTDEEVAALNARIRELEAQMGSAWALGLTDDPPPGYTA